MKLMSGELCSCFVVVLHVCICMVLFLCNSGLVNHIMQVMQLVVPPGVYCQRPFKKNVCRLVNLTFATVYNRHNYFEW